MASDDRSSKLKDSEPPPVLSREEEALREASNTLRHLAQQLLDVHRLALGEALDALPEPPGSAWGND